MIDVNEFIAQSNDKFEKLKRMCIDTIDWDKYDNTNEYNIKYGKDISIIASDKQMFSASILRHIDVNKCLFSKLHNNLPKRSLKQNYTLYYFDNNDKLIMSEYLLDDLTKQLIFYISNGNENIQIKYFIMPDENGQQKKYFSAAEYALYDSENKVIKCETYIIRSKPPYGISAYGEYYKYDDEGKLIRAIKYDDYNKKFKMDAAIKELCPELVINPLIFEYDFEYEQDHIFCQKTRKYSRNENKIKRFELNISELIKLSDNGVDCFGIKKL